jgi:hypothetical protein
MVAEVMEQEVAPDSTPTLAPVGAGLEAEPAQPAAEPEVKPERKKQFAVLSVREDERQLPTHIQIRLGAYRAEINALNKALRERNLLIPRLRHEARLNARVMRLKQEARLEGAGELIKKLAAREAQLKSSEEAKAKG